MTEPTCGCLPTTTITTTIYYRLGISPRPPPTAHTTPYGLGIVVRSDICEIGFSRPESLRSVGAVRFRASAPVARGYGHSPEKIFLVWLMNVLPYCVAVPVPFSVPRQSVPLKVQFNVLLLIVAVMLN